MWGSSASPIPWAYHEAVYAALGPSCRDWIFDALLLNQCRAILLDIGTGLYQSGSLPWFTEFYRQKNVEFNDILGAAQKHC
jgi:hypothetical protein